MSIIIAGHFQTQDEIDQARAELENAGFAPEKISGFFLNPPGQHDMTPIGGDFVESPGATEASLGVIEGAATGSAIGIAVGAVTSPVTGLAGPIVGGLVGAHVGSLYSLHKMKEAGEPEAGGGNLIEPRKPGLLVAVELADPSDQGRALDVLHQLRANHVEVAEGSIIDGDWIDFDPLSNPVIIA
jgi:hypothetical protein